MKDALKFTIYFFSNLDVAFWPSQLFMSKKKQANAKKNSQYRITDNIRNPEFGSMILLHLIFYKDILN